MSRKIQKLLPAVALAMAASDACAQILYEPFNYTVGAQLDAVAADANKNYSTSGTYWSSRGTQAGLVTVATGLGAPNAAPPLPSPMGNSELFPTTGVGRTPTLGFGQTATSGDLYYSLSLNAPSGTLGAAAGTFAGFSNFSIPTPNAPTLFQAALRYQNVDASTYNLGLNSGGQTGIVTTKNFTASDTVLVVARYTIVPGTNNDQVALWLNPQTGFGNNGAIPAPDVTLTHTSNDSVDSAVPSNPMLAGFFTRSFSSLGGFKLDELRVDTTWAGVTPDGNLQYTWTDAGAGTNTFANANKWTKTGSAPAAAPNGTGHVANFGSGIASGSTVTSAGETFDTLNFTNTGSVTIDGTGLTVGSNSSAGQIYAYAGSHTIAAPLTMGSNLSIKTQTGATVNLGGAVTGAGKTLGVYGTGSVVLGSSNLIDDAARLEVRSGTLNLNGGSETVGDVQLGTGHTNNGTAISAGVLYNGDLASGTISNGTLTANSYDLQSGTISASLAGANAGVGATKNLTGTVTLSGNNSYAGTTTVNSGVLTLSGTNSNPVNAVLNIPPTITGATATLAVTSDASLGASGATVSYASTAGVGGTLQFNNDMTLAANRQINAAAVLSRLASASGTTANVEALITGSGGINVTYPFDNTVGSTVAAAGPPAIVATGGLSLTGGVVVLRNTGNNYTGNTTVSGGRLLLPSTAVAPGFGVAGRYATVAPPGALGRFAGAVLSVNYGGPSDWASADVDTLRTTANFGTNAAHPANTYLGFDTTNATTDSTYASAVPSGTFGLSKHGPGTLILSGDLAQTGGVLVAQGTLVPTGNNSYAGQAVAEGSGILRVTTNTALGSTAGNTFVRGATAGAGASVQLDGTAGNLSIGDAFLIEGKSSASGGNTTGHIDNTAGNNTVTGTITFDAGGTWYNLNSSAAGGKLTVTNVNNPLGGTTVRQLNLRGAGDGAIVGNYTNTPVNATDVRLAKFDSGTWTISGSNTYTGSTTVNAGRLQVTQTAALPGFATSGKVVVKNSGTLGLNVGGGGEWTSGDIDALKGAATFDAGSVLALDSTNAAGTFTHASNVAGVHGVTKLGAGTVALTGNNSYTGGTNVAAGTLEVTRMHAANAVTIAAGATLRVQPSAPAGSDPQSGDNAFVSQPSMLTVDPAGFLDVTNNDVIIDYTGVSPAGTYEALVRSAYNVTGDWAGPGITSSIAAADGNYIVAIADNAALAAPFGTAQGGSLFAGVDVDLDTILIKFTHRADINLDGLITPDDSAIFGGAYDESITSGHTWVAGDMNYDGMCTPDDAAIFGGAYDESLTQLPEPASIGALGMAAAMLARRRRVAKPA